MDRRDQLKTGSHRYARGQPNQSTRSNSEPSTTQSTIMLTTASATTTMASTPSKRQPWNLRSSSVGVSSKIISLGIGSVDSTTIRDGAVHKAAATADSNSIMVHPAGFEPAIPSFVGWCLIQFGHGCRQKGAHYGEAVRTGQRESDRSRPEGTGFSGIAPRLPRVLVLYGRLSTSCRTLPMIRVAVIRTIDPPRGLGPDFVHKWLCGVAAWTFPGAVAHARYGGRPIRFRPSAAGRTR